MKYRKKPVVIEAFQWKRLTGCDGEITPIPPIPHDLLKLKKRYVLFGKRSWWIKTLEGDHKISDGDYIIRGVKGEYYPCKPDIFEETYEKAEANGK